MTRQAPRLETDRLILRKIALTDAPAIDEIFSDFAVARWLSLVPHPYPAGEAELFVEVCDGYYMWAIELRDVPGLIGTIGCDTPENIRALAFWVGRPHWGMGIASEAAREVLRFAFEDLAANEVISGAFEGNDASMHIQRKLGFRVTGQRMLYSHSNGRELPHIDSILTRPAWEAQMRKGFPG
ncbi:MAG: GNAT family N-acetyltransferase [Pseudomonadota bacterium]